MDYKKILRSQSLRFKILEMLQWIPDKWMLSMQYRIKHGRPLNLKNPKRFTEWVQWYKINYRNPLMQQCVDKYAVRKYVESKGLGHLLVPLLGVYENAFDIDLNSLPDKFVMKASNGSGGQDVVFVTDKSKVDWQATCAHINERLNLKKFDGGREWAYTGISHPVIIVEEMLYEDERGLTDWKFCCANGKPHILVIDADRFIRHVRNFYTMDWKFYDVATDCDSAGDRFPKPENWEEIKAVAAKLSEDFPFVRVDLYNIRGRIYFGELTFYPMSGYVNFDPDNFDEYLGSFWEGMKDNPKIHNY